MAGLMQDELNCPICQDRFVYPKLLRCGHTFCQFCLEQLTPREARGILCLICKDTTPKPDGGIENLRHNYNIGESTARNQTVAQNLPNPFVRDAYAELRPLPVRQMPPVPQNLPNVFEMDAHVELGVTLPARRRPPELRQVVPQCAAELGQLYLQDPLAASKRRTCNECGSMDAVICCLDCARYMCQKCLKRHNVREALARHTLIKIGHLKKCEEHRENCSHVCVDCGQLVCVACTQDDCSEHTVRRIGDAARHHVGDGDLKARLAQSRTSYTRLRERRVEKYNSIQDEITSTTKRLIRMLQAQEENMLRDLKTKEDICFGRIDSLRREEEEQIKAITEACAASERPLHEGIPRAVLMALPKLEALQQKRKASTDVPTFHPCNEATVGEIRQNTVETKRVFRFEKIVLIKEERRSTLLGKDGDIIVRNDFRGANDNCVQLFRRGTDREYNMEAKRMAKLPSILNNNRIWRPYIPNIRQMTYKIKDYARSHHLQLNKIVIKTPINTENV